MTDPKSTAANMARLLAKDAGKPVAANTSAKTNMQKLLDQRARQNGSKSAR